MRYDLKMHGGQLVTTLYVQSLRLWANLTRKPVAEIPDTTDVCVFSRALLGLFAFVAVFSYLIYWVISLAATSVIQQSANNPGYWSAVIWIISGIVIVIVGIVCAIVAIAFALNRISLLKEKLTKQREAQEEREQEKQAGFFRAAYLSLKEKYCPFIDVVFDDRAKYRVRSFPIPIVKTTIGLMVTYMGIWLISTVAAFSIKDAEIIWEGECTVVPDSFSGKNAARIEVRLACPDIADQRIKFDADDDFIIAVLNNRESATRSFACTKNALGHFDCDN